RRRGAGGTAAGGRWSAARGWLAQPSAVRAGRFVAASTGVAIGAAHLSPFDPIATNFAAVRKAPSSVHLLGPDEVGRDVLSRLIWGARASLIAGVIPVTIAVGISIPLGLLSGYAGGWVVGLLMRMTDAVLD